MTEHLNLQPAEEVKMPHHNFDTHKLVKSFTKVGITEPHAEAIMGAIMASKEHNFSTLATKADSVGLENKISGVEQRLAARISDVEQRLEDKISGVEQRLEDKISGVEQRLEDKISGVEKKLEDKISGVEKKLEDKISGVEKKLEDKISGVEQRLAARISNIEEVMATKVDIAKLEALIMKMMAGSVIAVVGLIITLFVKFPK